MRALRAQPASTTRHHPRYPVDIWVDYAAVDLFSSSHVANISRGGVFIKAETALPLDAEVKMVLWLPGHSAVRARGRVVWSSDTTKGGAGGEPGCGIKFVAIPPTDWELLHDYVESLGVGPATHH